MLFAHRPRPRHTNEYQTDVYMYTELDGEHSVNLLDEAALDIQFPSRVVLHVCVCVYAFIHTHRKTTPPKHHVSVIGING